MKYSISTRLTRAERIKQFIATKSYPNEIWKEIEVDGYTYHISSEGRVLNSYGRLVCIKPSPNGYRHLGNTTVHRGVAYAFGLIKELRYTGTNEVDHINNIKSDCRLINLQVLSHQENINKRDSTGNARRRTIDCYEYKTNKYLRSYNSLKEAAEDLGVFASNICFTLRGKFKQTGGYVFIYSDNKEKYEYIGNKRKIEKAVIDCYKNGELYKTYKTVTEAAADLGIRRQSISYVLHERQKTSYKIYTFKYRKI